MKTTNEKLNLDNNAETVSKALGYDTMKDLETAFTDGTMPRDKEFAFKLIVAVDGMPKGAGAFIMALLKAIYGEDMVYNKSSMAETLANAITDEDTRKRIEMISMMLLMESHIGKATSGGMGDLGSISSMLQSLKDLSAK